MLTSFKADLRYPIEDKENREDTWSQWSSLPMIEAWFKRAEDHHLNQFEDMSLTLRTAFREQVFAWVPYLFVYIGNRIRHATPEQGRALLAFIKNMEQHLIEKSHMQAVGFRFVGSV
jgi:hypothetical protein